MKCFLFLLVNIVVLNQVQGLDVVHIQNQEEIGLDYIQGIWKDTSDHLQAQNVIIKKRGNSSLHFKKGQYQIRFTTKGMNGAVKKVSHGPLGLPKGRKWVLYGPYVDRSLLRNALVYRIGHKMRPTQWWSPRSKYFELFINNRYEGIYLITEKIERGENRLSLKSNNFSEKNQKNPYN